MVEPTLSQMLDLAQKMAEDAINEIGEVPRAVLCWTGHGERFLIAVDSAPTAMQRRLVALKIGNQMRDRGVVAYAVAGEAWLSISEKGEDLKQPSKDPDRIDAVFLEAHNAASKDCRAFRIDRTVRPAVLRPLELDGSKFHPGATWDSLLLDQTAKH